MSLSDLMPVFYVGVIFGLVEMVKRLGVSGNKLVLVSMAVGIVLSFIYYLQVLYPQISPWVQVGFQALAYGLAASGLYDFLNQRMPKI